MNTLRHISKGGFKMDEVGIIIGYKTNSTNLEYDTDEDIAEMLDYDPNLYDDDFKLAFGDIK